MELVVVADTHVSGGLFEKLPAAAVEAIRTADAVVHTGDIIGKVALDELRSAKTTYAVLGNNDRELVGTLPLVLVVSLEGVRITIVHDAGDKIGRERRMKRRFPDADVVVFGHSHVPYNAPGVDDQLLFNPGSATQRRAAPNHTIGRLCLVEGVITRHTIEIV